jgi:outer membrane beta-barrel protein
MENRIQHLLLSALLTASLPALGDDQTLGQVIEPELERRTVERPAIDTENFEVGLYYGVLSIEDFDTGEVIGASIAYHITEDLFFEATYGQSEGDRTSYEELSGGAQLLDDSGREYTYYNVSLGWNVLPGEVFFGGRAFNSSFYLIGGVGRTEFANDNWFTVTVGAGYRLLLTDWLALRIDVRDHLFDRDVFGTEELTQNIELRAGLSYFF